MYNKKLVPLLQLQSYSDASYPGMVLEEDDSMTILYYSSTPDGKSKIYITRVNPVDGKIRN